jgi:hypothetical protein
MRKDLLTGEPFVPKRKTQRFANAANRIAYHNRKATELRHQLAYLNIPLHRNFKILSDLMEGSNEREFHKQFLLGKGLDFNAFNNSEKYEGKNYYAIFNFIVINIDKSIIKIVRK